MDNFLIYALMHTQGEKERFSSCPLAESPEPLSLGDKSYETVRERGGTGLARGN